MTDSLTPEEEDQFHALVRNVMQSALSLMRAGSEEIMGGDNERAKAAYVGACGTLSINYLAYMMAYNSVRLLHPDILDQEIGRLTEALTQGINDGIDTGLIEGTEARKYREVAIASLAEGKK